MSGDAKSASGEALKAEKSSAIHPLVKVGLYLCLTGVIFFAGMLTENWLISNLPSDASSDRASSPRLTVEAFASRILMATNDERVKAGLQPLQESSQLNASAKAKLAHLVTEDYWAHDAPDGTTPWDFIADAGYSYETASENLARNFATPNGVVAGWMGSPSHRESMMTPGYTEVGIAVRYLEWGVLEDSNGWIVVAHYAKPL